MSRKITFIVPTLDGLKRLELLCSWLHYGAFQGKVVVVDATIHSQKSQLEKFDFVEYVHAVDCSPHLAFFIALKHVKSEYVSLLGDDDFPMIKKITEMCNFLDACTDYDSICAQASFVELDVVLSANRYRNRDRILNLARNVLAARYDPPTDLSSKCQRDRLRKMIATYTVTQFFVTRTELVKNINPEVFSNFNDIHTSEIANNYAHALTARTYRLKGLYLLRGLARHRANSMDAHPRHKLLDTGIVENDVNEYLLCLNLEPDIRAIVRRAILAHRYSQENERLLEIRRDFKVSRYIRHQFRRLVLVTLQQSFERWRFLLWLFRYQSLDSDGSQES